MKLTKSIFLSFLRPVKSRPRACPTALNCKHAWLRVKISGPKLELCSNPSKLGHENCRALEPENSAESEHNNLAIPDRAIPRDHRQLRPVTFCLPRCPRWKPRNSRQGFKVSALCSWSQVFAFQHYRKLPPPSPALPPPSLLIRLPSPLLP